jgi:hypothetical protein
LFFHVVYSLQCLPVLIVATLTLRSFLTKLHLGRHLRALQDIASMSGGNRAAGTPGHDRSAEYVAEKLKEAGYLVHFEDFEFPFFEERVPPVLLVSYPDGRQEPPPAAALLRNAGCASTLVSMFVCH